MRGLRKTTSRSKSYSIRCCILDPQPTTKNMPTPTSTTGAPQPREVFSIAEGDTAKDSSESSTSDAVGKVFSNSDAGITKIDDDEDEKLLCSKLNGLSFEERTQAIHELHGVAGIEEETAEMLEKKLREMTEIAESFGDTGKTAAYRKALKMGKAYVNDKIRLMCLRADYYDSEKAAARMVSFFSFKQQLFGDDKLARDIVLDDFTGEDRECLDSGVCQILQQRDQAGRGITMNIGGCRNGVDSLSRAYYYVHMSALRDEEIQKKGVVVIYYGIGQDHFVGGRPSKFANVWWLLPVRLVAMHICYDQVVMDLAVKMLSQAMEAHHLCRLRVHKGSNQECIFNLMTFGVSRDVWPFDEKTGELNLEAHHQWLNSLRAREQLQLKNRNLASGEVAPQENEVIVRGAMDIIVGMGRQPNSSVGYMKFRDLLQSYREEYENADRFEKTVIASLLFQRLRDDGCRFIRCSAEGVMAECTEIEARDKISHCFRNMRQTSKPRRKGRKTGTTKRGNDA